jgi:hypothetical protein
LRRNLLRLFFILPAIEAILAVGLIFSAPSEGGNALLLGLSLSRLLLVAALLAVAFFFAAIVWLNLRNHKLWQRLQTRILAALQNRFVYALVLVLSGLLALVAFYLCLLTFKFTDAFVLARLQRLLPIFLWLALFAAQLLVFAPLLGRSAQITIDRRSMLPALLAFLALAAVAVFIALSGLGLRPDRAGWDTPGTPLMATQILIAWLGALLLVAILGFAERKLNWQLSRVDWLAVFVLWLLAVVLWQSQPLSPTYFSPGPQAPNFSYYPYSDAAAHDVVAQNLLVGQGFSLVSEKPLYSFFLAAVHVLFGQDYTRIVTVQIVLLALFPAVLYLLATRMHHRLSGALLGLALILRERNAIALSGEINVSHSKLLMTDLPTALGIALFALLLLRWLQSDRQQLRWPLFVGAALGFLMLLRSQNLVLLPLLLLVAFWQGGKSWRPRLMYSGVLLLGFVLAALPWLLRNYAHTGQFGYSQPLQAAYLARQYSLTPEANDPGFPPDTPLEQYVTLGFANVRRFTLEHPGEVARFISAHFLHNEVSSLLALPIRFDLSDKLVNYYNLLPYWEDAEGRLWSECCSLDAHIANTPYWQSWNGDLPADAILPILANLALIAIGIGVAWKRVGWLALVPLGLHLAYNFSTAVARVSGWRLVLPVDWVLIMYYCIGLGQLSLWAWAYFAGQQAHKATEPRKKTQAAKSAPSRERLPQYAALILLAALSLPLTELLVPDRYAAANDTSALAAWRQSDFAGATSLDPAAFLEQDDATVLTGRALYPRYYAAGFGEPGGQWPAFNPQPFARLGFVLVGPGGQNVILPLQSAPAAFPNAVDVIVFACQAENYLRAVAVLFPNHEAADLISDFHTFSCDTAP